MSHQMVALFNSRLYHFYQIGHLTKLLMVRYMEGDTFKFEVHMKLAIIQKWYRFAINVILALLWFVKKNEVTYDRGLSMTQLLKTLTTRTLSWMARGYLWRSTTLPARFWKLFWLFSKDVNIHPVLLTGLLFCNSTILPLHFFHFNAQGGFFYWSAQKNDKVSDY